jgi:hypothetical protein
MYKVMVVKMVIDSPTIGIAKTKYELLCDVEASLGLACVFLLLKSM